MPGQILSVPFISQLEDMDKYLMEYRSLKLMPQNGVIPLQQQQQGQSQQQQYRYQNRAGGQGMSGQQRKRISHGSNNSSVNHYVSGAAVDAGNCNSGGKRFQIGNLQAKYGAHHHGHHHHHHHHQQQQQQQQQLINPLQTSFQKTYPQVFYPSSSKPNGNGSNISLPLIAQQTPQPGQQQSFLTSSSSSGSTSPPRLQSSISGGSTINSLSSDFGDYIMPSDFHKQYDSIAYGQTASGSPAMSNFNMVSPFVQSNSPPISSAATSNDLMQVFPSSLLGDTSSSGNVSSLNGSRSMVASMFSSNSFPSSSNQSTFTMLPAASSTWGNSTGVSTAGPTTVNQSSTSSTASGSFGIWNNDMSVWG
ncbi:uncharacterized protein Ecym_7150 [Eremothecium cymbalariae DBVPG|uniref:Uncharacterized protein n=1 Tax=Eremothecium cymbalariae (strain CBS 270.75 / DBVPG 7215 / KCTC 17166 / NRRL Y-17582) TaxID=931890 RepID=G8JVY4_ERECY|nr:hypothetical protein Ecym_7150 [Eremothecium cymbalariae DBVPG\